MNVSLYVATNALVPFPKDHAYKPIFCGESAQTAPPGYLTDATGDNISTKNVLYCELTALYWAWKNDVTSDYIGLCHYRRYFNFAAKANHGGERDFNTITATDNIADCLADCDIILTEKKTGENSQYDDYVHYHREQDIKTCIKIVQELYPDYLDSFRRYLEGREMYGNQMFITSREIFHKYMKWLFDILSEAEKRIYLSYDHSYQRRALGFLAERLLTLYVQHNRLKVKEFPLLQINSLKYEKNRHPARAALLGVMASAGKRRMVFACDGIWQKIVTTDFAPVAENLVTIDDGKNNLDMNILSSYLNENTMPIIFTRAMPAVKDYLQKKGCKENADFVDGTAIWDYLLR